MTTPTFRVGQQITTAEQLDALWDLQDVLIEATGTFPRMNGEATFSECWARPVPEHVGGQRGMWEVLVYGQTFPESLTTSEHISTATVRLLPGEPSSPPAPCFCGGAPAEIGGAEHRPGCGEEPAPDTLANVTEQAEDAIADALHNADLVRVGRYEDDDVLIVDGLLSEVVRAALGAVRGLIAVPTPTTKVLADALDAAYEEGVNRGRTLAIPAPDRDTIARAHHNFHHPRTCRHGGCAGADEVDEEFADTVLALPRGAVPAPDRDTIAQHVYGDDFEVLTRDERRQVRRYLALLRGGESQ